MLSPTIVCLCGSTRFWREFQRANLRETLAGRIVLSIGAASSTDDNHFGNLPKAEYERVKKMLDELHLRKVEMADEVFIIDAEVPYCEQCQSFRVYNTGCPGAHPFTGVMKPYIGESTRRELEHALKLGKNVRFFSKEKSN